MKWRKYKKKFKKEALPKLKGSIIGIDAVWGIPMKIKTVKLIKVGGHHIRQEYSVEPCDKQMWEDAQKKIDFYEKEMIRMNGLSLTFDVPKPVPLDKIFGL